MKPSDLSKRFNILFISNYRFKINDGLSRAIDILGFDKYNITDTIPDFTKYDFILGHGAFDSNVDELLQTLPNKKGLCIGGNVKEQGDSKYDVMFYETRWVRDFLKLKGECYQAFGINTEIHNSEDPILHRYKSIDYLSVGALALWKRHEKLAYKKGVRLVVGEMQRDNKVESLGIANNLIASGVGVMPQVRSEMLTRLYHASRTVYIPADIYGGGERAVWEAKSCGVMVEIEPDNPKLKELVDSPVMDEFQYARDLAGGIATCL
jgi:hypothetical protein